MNTETTNAADQVTKERLAQDLRVVISDAEELLRATASQAGDKVSAARERIHDSLASAKERLAEAQEQVSAKTRQAARATDNYVHEHPWRAVSIAAGAGLLLGMLISRSR